MKRTEFTKPYKTLEVVERCVEMPHFQLIGLRESGLELPEVNQIEAL